MSPRRFSLFDLFLFMAFCSLLLAFFVPLFRQGADRANYVQGLVVSADGSTVAALFGNGKVRVWRTSDQSLLAAFDAAIRRFQSRIAVSADGTLAAVCSGMDPTRMGAGEIEFWDIGKAEKLATLPYSGFSRFAFAPHGATLAVGNTESSVDLYRCRKDAAPERAKTLTLAYDEMGVESGDVPAMAFSADGKTLAIASAQSASFWETETGERLHSLATDHPGGPTAMAMGGDGKWLALCGYDSQSDEPGLQLEVWDVAAAKKAPELPDSQDLDNAVAGADSLAFLPDGRTLLFAGGQLRAWDVETGMVRTVSDDDDASTLMLAAPREGNRFAVADFQKVTLWDATTLAPAGVLWTPPTGEPSLTMLIAAVVLFVIWVSRRNKKRLRQCATCGQSYYLANAKDSQTECPNCRLAALPAEVRAKRQAKDRRKGWFGLALLGFCLILISLLGGVGGVLWILGTGTIVIPVLIGGLCAWAHFRGRRLSRESGIVQLVEPLAGVPAEVLRYGPVMVWCGEGTTLGREIERELAVCTDRVRSLTGQAVTAGPWLRCFVFGRREHFEQALKALGFVLGKGSYYDGVYLGAPPRVAFLEESEERRKSPDPLASLRCVLVYHLIEPLEISFRTPWLNGGLAHVVAHAGDAARLARLNRRVLADVAARRTLDAKAFFAPLPRIVWNLKLPAERDSAAVTQAAAREVQQHSFMEFLCGAGSTPERRLAFQRFLVDPRRQKRQDEALVASFGCSPETLLDDWRQWVEQVGVGQHVPPPAEYAEVLASGPVATIENEQAPLIERLRAIRRLGREGFVVGIDALIGVLRQGPDELAAEAVWALEAISAQPLGADVAAWEAWRANLPAEIGDSQSQIR
ncbi:MAG TPA: hypothetical protein VHB99_01265 [Pirellulales bacterium]|nr:hypothetical protein [Pirellulales bacterium]